MKTKKAEVGISLLVILLAIVLISAIASTLIFSMVVSTSSKGYLMSHRTEKKVGTIPQIIQVYARDGTDGYVDDTFVKLRLLGGSDDLNLQDISLEVDLSNASSELEYSPESCAYDATLGSGDGYYTDGEAGTFTVDYLVKGGEYEAGFLKRGDIVRFCFRTQRSVGEYEEVRITMIAKSASTIQVIGLTPRIMQQYNEQLYPK